MIIYEYLGNHDSFFFPLALCSTKICKSFLTMSPVEKHKDTPHVRHRSFKGCWTCKKKRVQCDEVRPSCQRCNLRGITCEGYEIRLRWGAGIASRGKYSGAEKPVKESIPPRSKRRWDMRGKREESEEGDRQGQPMLVAQTEGISSEGLL
jgi:hypothetical protein